MDGYIYGFEPAEISLTLMGFVMQDAFMAALSGASGDDNTLLAALTTISGLIGLAILFLAGKKVGGVGIFGWCLIMVLMVTFPNKSSTNRPDPLLYTNVAQDPVLDRVVAYGGILSQQEMEGLVGEDAQGVQYRDIVKEKMPEALTFDAVYGFTPHVQILHYLNLINLALNVEMVPFGRRASGGGQAFIEAIKYARTADPEAPFQTAEYTLACKDSGVVRDTAFRSTLDVASKDAPSWSKLRGAKITARRARELYLMYADYANTRGEATAMLPPLVIGACGNAECTDAAELPAQLKTAFQPIMFDSWQAHATPENVAFRAKNLKEQFMSVGEENDQLLDTTYVQLAVPIGLNGVKENVLKAVEADAAVVQRWDSALESAIWGGGTIFSIAPMMWASMLTLQDGMSDGSGWFSGGDFDEAELLEGVDRETIQQLVGGMQAVTTPKGNDRYFKVGNCQQMHWIKSTRQTLATLVQMDTTSRLEDLLAEYKDKPEFYNYNARTATDQAKFAVNLQVRAQQGECVDTAIHRGGVTAAITLGLAQNWAENVTAETKARCLKSVNRVVDQVNYSLQGNDWAAVNAVMRTATSPEFTGDIRNLASEAGSFIAPVAIWFKGIFGGFSAGTYSEIMPQIVSFGIALALIIAPLLMMLGLMLPMYSMNAIMLPIMLIGYLGFVKITFTLIRVFAGIFNTAFTAGNVDAEQARLVDIAMGNAYGAAFLMTGAILVMLRNPSAILQKLGGSADKASSVSFQEVMAAGGAMAIAKKAVGVGAAVASGGASAAVGKVAGSLAAGGILKNQAAGFKSGYLQGVGGSHKYDADAAEFDALQEAPEGISGTKYKNKIADGKASADKQTSRLDETKMAQAAMKEAEEEGVLAIKDANMGRAIKGATRLEEIEFEVEDKEKGGTKTIKKQVQIPVDSYYEQIADGIADEIQKQAGAGSKLGDSRYAAKQMAYKIATDHLVKMGQHERVSGVKFKGLAGRNGPDKQMIDKQLEDLVSQLEKNEDFQKAIGKK